MCFLKKRGDSIWQIGRVIQFAHYLERTKKAKQYKATTVNIKETWERLVFYVRGLLRPKKEFTHLDITIRFGYDITQVLSN